MARNERTVRLMKMSWNSEFPRDHSSSLFTFYIAADHFYLSSQSISVSVVSVVSVWFCLNTVTINGLWRHLGLANVQVVLKDWQLFSAWWNYHPFSVLCSYEGTIYWVGVFAEVQYKPSINVLKYIRTSAYSMNMRVCLDSKEIDNFAAFGYWKVQSAKC